MSTNQDTNQDLNTEPLAEGIGGLGEENLADKSEENLEENLDSKEEEETVAADAATAEDPVQKELREAKAEAKEHLNSYLRAIADLDNIRRRHEREKEDTLRYGLEIFIKDMLPILDSFDKGFSEKAPDDTFREGMHMVHKQLKELLSRRGLTEVQSVGAAFDPQVHQAINQVESDVNSETVAAEYSKGYQLNGRLLRPAMVSVAIPIKSAEINNEPESPATP